MKRIKVAMLAPYLMYYPRIGGAEVHIKKTIKYLSDRDDIELHLINIGNKRREFKEGNVNVHMVRRLLPYPVPILSSAWSLKHKVIEVNPDIVHAIGSGYVYSTAAAFLRNRYPTLLTVIGLILKEIEFYKGMELIDGVLFQKPNERYAVSKIQHIIVQSSPIKNLLSNMTNSKIYVVPEGIEFGRSRDALPHELGREIDIFGVIRYCWLKGVDILIKAIPTVIESIPDLKVYIAGGGEEEEKLKSLVKNLGLENHMKFLGYISDEEEINRYYKACKIVVVPSRWDVDPFAPLNAAAAGKPAIVSDMCNSSVIEDGKTGFVFKSEDVGELSGKIVKLLTDHKLREEMGKAALERAKKCDWSEVANRKVEIYKEVIADFYGRKRTAGGSQMEDFCGPNRPL